jgi:hypothetical protein
MVESIIETIKSKVRARKFKYTLHARNEALNDGINIQKTIEIFDKAEMIEDYPDDPRGHSCLILGWLDKKPVHLVCGISGDDIILITIYMPDPERWIDHKIRRLSQ